MTPEQALNYLMQMLVLKPGVSIPEAAGVLNAWNLLEQMASKKPEQAPQKDEKQAEG